MAKECSLLSLGLPRQLQVLAGKVLPGMLLLLGSPLNCLWIGTPLITDGGWELGTERGSPTSTVSLLLFQLRYSTTIDAHLKTKF